MIEEFEDTKGNTYRMKRFTGMNNKISTNVSYEFTVTLKLTVEEARALKEMTGYGAKPFLEGYYKQLGKSYMQPHEKGVYSLFDTINRELPQQIALVDKADKLLKEIQK